MKKDKYSDGLLDEMFKVIDEKLDRIIEQTTKTIGRVTHMEDWKSKAQGAWFVMSAFVIPVLLYLVYLHLNK